jgi:O-antigen ligase
MALTSTVLAVGVAAIFIAPSINVGAIRDQAAGSIPLLRDSVGRSGGSASERGDIVREGLRVFFSGDATGVGPARTKATLQADQAPYVKEAHNDYLATLLERGPLGVLGLLVLTLSVAVRSLRLVGRPGRRDELAAEVPRPWLLVSVCLVMASAAGFYEVLHFRHLWTFLGLLAALSLSAEVGAGAPLPLDGPAERTAQKAVQRTQRTSRRTTRAPARSTATSRPAADETDTGNP